MNFINLLKLDLLYCSYGFYLSTEFEVTFLFILFFSVRELPFEQTAAWTVWKCSCHAMKSVCNLKYLPSSSPGWNYSS